jgi:hypothetical protein
LGPDLSLFLALTIGCATVGAVHDRWGERVSRRTAPFMAVLAALFFAATRVDSSFLVYIVYEALFRPSACY